MGAGWLGKMVQVRRGEQAPTVLAAVAFALILYSYALLRPVREAMGIQRDFNDLYWLWIATLIGMVIANVVYAFLATRIPTRLLASTTYRVFGLSLAAFVVLLTLWPGLVDDPFATIPGWIVRSPVPQPITVGHAFYVWLSVFNLFAISLFWAQAAGTFTLEQAKRLYPLIAAGGTIGALAGSFTTTMLAREVQPAGIMALSLILLRLAVMAGAWAFGRQAGDTTLTRPTGAATTATAARPGRPRLNAWRGLRNVVASPYLASIGAWVMLLAIASSLMYFTQVEIVRDQGRDLQERVFLFAKIDLLTQGFTLLLQLAATAMLLRLVGVGRLLLACPIVLVVGFIAIAAADALPGIARDGYLGSPAAVFELGILAVSPVYAIMALFQASFRAAERAIARPARETLFSVVAPEEKYVTKPAIDTFVYRSGDVLGSTLHGFLHSMQAGLVPILTIVGPLAILWAALGLWLGWKQKKLAPTDPRV